MRTCVGSLDAFISMRFRWNAIILSKCREVTREQVANSETHHTLIFPLFTPCVVHRHSGASEELFPACTFYQTLWPEANLRTLSSLSCKCG